MTDDARTVNALAQVIRRVDGQHTLGAAALAEALLPEIRQLLAAETSPGERHALATIEAVEGLTIKASEALDNFDLNRVHALHSAILNETSVRTATATGELSNQIGAVARLIVQARLAEVDEAVAFARAEARAAARVRAEAAARSVTGVRRSGRSDEADHA